MGDLKTIALLALLSQKTRETNGNTKATMDFTIKLENGQNIYVSRGQDITFDKERLGVGAKAFQYESGDGFLAKVFKTLANDQVSDFQYEYWENIRTIV